MLIVETIHEAINLIKPTLKKLCKNMVMKAEALAIINNGIITFKRNAVIGRFIFLPRKNIRQMKANAFVLILVISTHTGLKPIHKNNSDKGKLINVKQLIISWYFFMSPVACIDICKGTAIALIRDESRSS